MKAVSLHVGLNHVSPAHYGGDQPLKNPVNDARAMRALADAAGFTPSILLDNQASVAAVATAIQSAAADLVAGDIFLLTYAGHGAQMFDRTGDEPDSLDETWCLFDRMVLDDELHGLYTGFAAGVRLLIISDSCHSGTVARPLRTDFLLPQMPPPTFPEPDDEDQDRVIDDPLVYRSIDRDVSRATFLNNQARYLEAKALSAATRNVDLKCSLLLLAACQDDQLASDGDDNGYFTKWLLHFWRQGQFTGSYQDLFTRMDAAMPQRQKPNLWLRGPNTDAFVNQPAFAR